MLSHHPNLLSVKHLIGAALTSLVLVAAVPSPAGATFLAGATPGPHQISNDGIHFIAQYERPPSLSPYNDPVHCTVGFGHLVSKYGCEDPRAAAKVAPYLHGFTMARALALFGVDLGIRVRCVNSLVTAPLTQGQFDALVSFAYNAGCPTLAKIAPLLNDGDFEAAAQKMARINKGDIWVGRKGHRHKIKAKLQGLVNRRRLENQKLLGRLLSGKPTPKSHSKQPIPVAPPVQGVHGVVLPKTSSDPSPAGGSAGDGTPPNSSDPGQPAVECPQGAAAQYSAVPPGCYQFAVEVTPSFLRTDPGNHLGFGKGVGGVTISPLGQTVDCPNPGDSPCDYVADLPIGTTVTLSQHALSQAGGPGGPSDPVDSVFDRWGGACSGSGSCSFTLSSNHMAVTASFVPALATLTVNQTGAAKAEVIVNPQRGSKPSGPVYCGNLGREDTQPLPCSVQTRVDGKVFLMAEGGPDSAFIDFTGDPCAMTAMYQCQISMDTDHSVTAEFAPTGLGVLA